MAKSIDRQTTVSMAAFFHQDKFCAIKWSNRRPRRVGSSQLTSWAEILKTLKEIACSIDLSWRTYGNDQIRRVRLLRLKLALPLLLELRSTPKPTESTMN